MTCADNRLYAAAKGLFRKITRRRKKKEKKKKKKRRKKGEGG